ncbi:MAG: penicillin-binding transpeptidase domain-containing protein [Planctomycetota bacterium]
MGTLFLRTKFGRRLLLVFAIVALAFAALATQTARLTVGRGDAMLAEAESRLIRQQWRPTVRGQIRDRHGRVLALDLPSFDVAVDYDVITGEWAQREAARAARQRSERWDSMSREQREAAARELLPEFNRRADRTWDLIAESTGLSRAEIDARRIAVQDEVKSLVARVQGIRAERELRAYAGSLGISQAELDRRTQALDRPDAIREADRLRHVLAREITNEAERTIEREIAEPIREQTVPHVIVPAIDDDTGFRLRRIAQQRDERLPAYPGLAILESHARDYPLREMDITIDRSRFPQPLRNDESRTVRVRGIASHLLGTVRRRLYAEDVDRRRDALGADPRLAARSVSKTAVGDVDRGRYFPGDAVGNTGLERTLEDTLRGMRGVTIDRLDEADDEHFTPEFGRDVTLTLDAMLQARVHALLDPSLGLTAVQPWHEHRERQDPSDPASPLLMPPGTPMNAAAVVIEVETGEILAMVSTPSFMPDGSHLPASEAERRELIDIRRPHVDRAVGTPLPPGSIAKALIYCAAHAEGLVGLDERIHCTGHLLEDQTDRLRCWIYKRNPGMNHDIDLGHAPNGAEALKVSCNIYFYTLGQRLGPEGILETYRRFGMGESLGLPLDHAHSGFLGRAGDESRVSIGDAILMGIGQGPVAWTPVHAADAYATLARGGIRVRPTLIAGNPPEGIDLGLHPGAIRETLRGLHLATNDPRGTAHAIPTDQGRFNIFDVPGVTVWGKTGTATAPSLIVDERVVRRGDHSWFVLLCGRDRPQYAVAVVAEYGGSGGRVSGPIANQIIHALVDEGYL